MYLSFSLCGVEENNSEEREISNKRFEKSWNYHGSLQLCTVLLTPASRSKVQALWTQSEIKLPTRWSPSIQMIINTLKNLVGKNQKKDVFRNWHAFPSLQFWAPQRRAEWPCLPPSPVLNKSQFFLPFPLLSASPSPGQHSIPTLPLLLVCVT